MNIFGNTSTGFSKEIDSAMSTFKSTITKLKATAEKAAATKVEKQEVECTALDGVSTKANNLAFQVRGII